MGYIFNLGEGKEQRERRGRGRNQKQNSMMKTEKNRTDCQKQRETDHEVLLGRFVAQEQVSKHRTETMAKRRQQGKDEQKSKKERDR
jgi:hypothetical protein